VNETTLLTRFGFFLGVGTMGVISGLGVGSKQPNKLALLVGVGSLVYANTLNQVVELRPGISEGIQRDVRSIRGRVPSVPFRGRPQDQAQFRYTP